MLLWIACSKRKGLPRTLASLSEIHLSAPDPITRIFCYRKVEKVLMLDSKPHQFNPDTMAKKRKASARSAPADEADIFEAKGGRMGPITTFEDVADSEDEFHINRDKVMLDDGPDAKRRREWQEEGTSYACCS